MNKRFHLNLSYVLVAMMVLLALQSYLSQRAQYKEIPYSEFRDDLKSDRLRDVVISDRTIEGTLKQSTDGRDSHVVAVRVDPALADHLDQYKISYRAIIPDTWLMTLLSWFAPVLVFYLVWVFLFRRITDRQGGMGGMGGLMSIGKSNAKVYVESNTRVTFADVAGVDEAKAELQEIVQFLKDPKRYGRLGARLPKGILLVGPPGTGKTLLARAVAGEAGVAFLSINGSEFVEMFVGVGAARVRDLFEQAVKQAPAIIFIDELDALGRARGATPWGGGHDEKEQTLNQLLSEMDGFDPRQGVVLIAATNRPEILDPALLRAGRFDRQVLVDRPDREGRLQILKVHIKDVRLADNVDLGQIAALTPGFSGADLANLINEAAIMATRRDAASVSPDDFTQAIERLVAGLEKRNRLLNPDERRIVAYHELGHAFVALALSSTTAVHKVSIIPRGVSALGYTIQRPTEDRYLMSRHELETRMSVLLGGRASELLIFGDASTGAADDLAKATDIARSMVTQYGLSTELGAVSLEDQPSNFLGVTPDAAMGRRYSEHTAQIIDSAVAQFIDQALRHATEALRDHRAALDKAATVLLSKETLQAEELKQLFAGSS